MSQIYHLSAQNNFVSRAEAVSSVKSQLEEAISCRLGSEPGKHFPAHLYQKRSHCFHPLNFTYAYILVRYADSSSSEEHSDYVLLDRDEN